MSVTRMVVTPLIHHRPSRASCVEVVSRSSTGPAKLRHRSLRPATAMTSSSRESGNPSDSPSELCVSCSAFRRDQRLLLWCAVDVNWGLRSSFVTTNLRTMLMMSNLDRPIYAAGRDGMTAGAAPVTEAADEALPETHVRVVRNRAEYRRYVERGFKVQRSDLPRRPGTAPGTTLARSTVDSSLHLTSRLQTC